VVTDALHFESALMHLLELKKKGLDVRIAKSTADGRIDMRDLERLVDKQTRLVEVSSVASYNGFQHDLKAVCDLAHANGAYVYADIIQSVGAVPLDVRAIGLDFAACSGFKWLMSDFGLGFLYAREDLLDRVIQRTQVGYYSGSVDTHDSPLDPEHATTPVAWKLGRDASNHFEAGSIGGNAAGAFAYSASLSYIQELGVANIQSHRQPLLRRLEQDIPKLGYPLLTPPGSTSPNHHVRNEGWRADREEARGRQSRGAGQPILVPFLSVGLQRHERCGTSPRRARVTGASFSASRIP
jgi:selenocysteine lyase/cysteine desulfurase